MSAAAQSRQFFSPALKIRLIRQLAGLAALALALIGVLLMMSLLSYHRGDASLDTASTMPTRNLAGPAGAIAADVLLQGFGLAGALPAMIIFFWAYGLAHRGYVPNLRRRCMVVLAVVPIIAAGLGMLSATHWPVKAGLGGAVGAEFGRAVARTEYLPFGDVIRAIVPILALVIGGGALVYASGLSAREWRAAGRRATGAALASARTGGRAVRGARGGASAVSAWLAPLIASAPMRGDGHSENIGVVAVPIAPEGGFVPDTIATLESEPTPILPRLRRAAPAKKAPPKQERLPLPDTLWKLPPLDLLRSPPLRAATGPSTESLQANARLLETVLGDYGVQGRIVEIRPGPVVTLYELEPAPGIRSARVIGLADDIARSLSVLAVRIATVQGRNVIGIEVPNARRETVFFSELLDVAEWVNHSGKLALALGKDIGGTPVIADLARMPHLLIAGTTGSGKSVGINAMILSLLYRLSPDECRLILIDPKMLELSVYEGIPHLLTPVVTEPAKAVAALKWVVREMERRYRSMSQLSVRNIAGYNERVNEALARGEVVTRRVQTGFDSETGRPIFEDQPLALEPLPLIVVVIDEMADLMMVAGKEIEAAVQRLAQMARAAGIHVIMATQRPSVDVITGTIKANFPTRISFQVISKFDSRTILGEQGAEQLLGMGDLLYMVGGGRITRVHGPFVSDREVEDVVAFLREQGEPEYVEAVTEVIDEDMPAIPGLASAGEGGEAGLYQQAVALVAREGKASTSFIQRHLQIGYNRAAKLMEQMEKAGVVSTANHVGKREVLIGGSGRDD